MKKTKLTRSLLAACSIVALSAVMYGCVHDGGDDAPATGTSGIVDPKPDPIPETVPVHVKDYVDVSGKDEQASLLAVLPGTGDSDTLTVPAGGSAMRGGVEDDGVAANGVEDEVGPVVFTCDSAYPCTFTLTNNLGTIVVSVSTQKLPDADEPTFMAMVPVPPDALPRLNKADADTIRGITSLAINAETGDGVDGTPDTADDTPRGAHGRDANGTMGENSIGGLGLGASGAADDTMLSLTSSLDPNGTPFAAAVPAGTPPTPVMGSTISVAMDLEVTENEDSVAFTGWDERVLFRDWGDTVGTGDGGYETGALIYSDIEGPIDHPFDGDLADEYVNEAAQALYALTVLADGGTPVTPGVATSVNINSDDSNAATTATAAQWAAMVFDSDSLVGAQSQDLNVNTSETFTGSYFGAPGQFQCIVMAADNCGLVRNDDGTVGVIDIDAAAMGIQSEGNWTFTPDPGAMIAVPDQDWMVFGAWLTTPDAPAGEHRVGVFYNGMDPYTPATDAFTANTAAGLRGSATYTGGAAGVYSHGAAAGLFTADAMLTANFDVNSNGMDDEATDYMISGRISNFRDTAGSFLGDDTVAMPNDPVAGGENDWVVMLGADDLDNDTAAGLVMGMTTGSADGVSWTGNWNGQLYGPGSGDDGSIAPSGVAGQFQSNNGNTSVVGAFGADLDD